MLSTDAADLASALTPLDRGLSAARRLSHSPWLIAAGVALLFASGPARALRWGSRAVLAVTLLRRLAAMWMQLRRVRD